MQGCELLARCVDERAEGRRIHRAAQPRSNGGVLVERAPIAHAVLVTEHVANASRMYHVMSCCSRQPARRPPPRRAACGPRPQRRPAHVQLAGPARRAWRAAAARRRRARAPHRRAQRRRVLPPTQGARAADAQRAGRRTDTAAAVLHPAVLLCHDDTHDRAPRRALRHARRVRPPLALTQPPADSRRGAPPGAAAARGRAARRPRRQRAPARVRSRARSPAHAAGRVRAGRRDRRRGR